VIAIIAVLAGMLLPAIRGGAIKAQKVRAAKDVQDIATAIKHYYADYSRMPVSGNIPFRTLPNTTQPATTADPDFTFGTFGIITNSTQNSLFVTNNNGVYETNNSEITGILLARTNFPYVGSGLPTVNVNHVLNPRRVEYLPSLFVDPKLGGLGQDGIFRDPWRNPYIVTVDTDGDGYCADAFYRRSAVSATFANSVPQPTGYNGLFNRTPGLSAATPPRQLNDYQLQTPVMVWSFGPDGKINRNVNALGETNIDNILSWKP